MVKGKDFYGTTVTEVIARACKELSVSQDELEIDILETGSAGIFGLCKKKAHIRAREKMAVSTDSPEEAKTPDNSTCVDELAKEASKQPVAKSAKKPAGDTNEIRAEKNKPQKKEAASSASRVNGKSNVAVERELPSADVLMSVKEEIAALLEAMTFPSDVHVEIVDYSVSCRISGDHEEELIGTDGRTLDSLQYLLRKMMSRRLPDRMMLSLDVGNYREQRAEELKIRAEELAVKVKEDGKTQAIPALNPSERRVVHMLLQEDKEIRSRSVGEGLFKKVLIYKPGKKKKSNSRKGKGRQGGRSSGNN